MDTVPTLMFGGTSDGLAGPPMPQDQYMSIPATTPKLLYVVNGGAHYVSTSPTNSGTDMAPDSTSTPTSAASGSRGSRCISSATRGSSQFIPVKPSDASEFDTTVM